MKSLTINFCAYFWILDLCNIEKVDLRYLGKLLIKQIRAISSYFFLFSPTMGRQGPWNKFIRSSHWSCLIKKMFLKVLHYSQENTCVRISFLNKVTGLPAWNFVRKRHQHLRFHVNLAKFQRTHIFKNICENCFWFVSRHFLRSEHQIPGPPSHHLAYRNYPLRPRL